MPAFIAYLSFTTCRQAYPRQKKENRKGDAGATVFYKILGPSKDLKHGVTFLYLISPNCIYFLGLLPPVLAPGQAAGEGDKAEPDD